jgi:integrase
MRQHLRSERVKLPRVHRVMKGGKLYKFHRITRASLPADIPEDHPTFIGAWTAEEARKAPDKTRGAAGSLSDAWARLMKAHAYTGLSADYRRVIQRHGEAIATNYGAAPMSGIRSRHIEADLAKLAPHAANARLKTWRLICKNAKSIGMANTIATDGISKPKAPKATSHAPWTIGEIAAYRARWPIGTAARKAMELLLWTGARTKDAVRLGPSFVGSDGMLSYRQTKTSNPAYVPWSSTLPDWAATWQSDRQMMLECLATGRGFTFLETSGRVRSHKGLSNTISAAAEKAGVEKTAHGLRATRLTLIAQAGGTSHAIMAWGGHVTLSEVEHYTRDADRRRILTGTEQDQNPVNHSVKTCKPGK